MEVTESVANEALFGSEDLLQSLRDRELRDWMWDADQDSAPNAEGSDVTEEMDADGAPEPVNVTSTNAATREVAGGTPGLEGAAGAPEARYGKGQVALVSESVFSLHATSVAEGIREVEAFLDENGENGVVLDDGRWDTLAYGVASLREQMPQMERDWDQFRNQAMTRDTLEEVSQVVDGYMLLGEDILERADRFMI